MPSRAAKLLTLLSLLACLSCARPHYVSGPEGVIDGISGDCGLYFKSESLCLQTQWVQRPSESTLGEMRLSFTDRSDPARFVDPVSTPAIVLWMPSMGHGSSPVTIERTDVGRFRASEIYFIMTGPWDIRYQLKNGQDVVEEKIQKVTI